MPLSFSLLFKKILVLKKIFLKKKKKNIYLKGAKNYGF